MIKIMNRVWYEPAVFIGFLTSLIMVIVTWTSGDWDTPTIIGIIAPLASSLGIREFVTPVAKLEDAGEKVP